MELLADVHALLLEDLAHPHERHVEGHLRHRQRAATRAIGHAGPLRRVAQLLGDRVAPAQAALGDLVERRVAVRGELAEQLEGLVGRLDPVLGATAGHPVRKRHRRERADLLQPRIDLGCQLPARLPRPRDDAGEHAHGAVAEHRAEPADLLLDLEMFRGDRRHGSQPHPAAL